ncbi:hypothetical protein CDAR_396191 [Caerostris darwini]|uniref:Uncharacterized protein n=1 Tax=Caerostris darwini TaxID=1538125 RepID=A0AAV4WR66_9ARAC|nr:hypothetical protein CDAR_396191 [Caerostris darwini]
MSMARVGHDKILLLQIKSRFCLINVGSKNRNTITPQVKSSCFSVSQCDEVASVWGEENSDNGSHGAGARRRQLRLTDVLNPSAEKSHCYCKNNLISRCIRQEPTCTRLANNCSQ